MESRGNNRTGKGTRHRFKSEGSGDSLFVQGAGSIEDRHSAAPLAKRIATIVATELLNEKEVAKILKTPTGTLRRWRCTGEGPHFIKLGCGPKAAVRYHPLDIERYIDDGRRFSIRAGSAGGEKQWP